MPHDRDSLPLHLVHRYEAANYVFSLDRAATCNNDAWVHSLPVLQVQGLVVYGAAALLEGIRAGVCSLRADGFISSGHEGAILFHATNVRIVHDVCRGAESNKLVAAYVAVEMHGGTRYRILASSGCLEVFANILLVLHVRQNLPVLVLDPSGCGPLTLGGRFRLQVQTDSEGLLRRVSLGLCGHQALRMTHTTHKWKRD